ncbi:MAG: DMT family transporter [Planctomycetota bacterium]
METQSRYRIDTLGTAAIVTSLFCWTAGPIFIRYLTGFLDAWTQNFLRYSAAAAFWLPFLVVCICRGNFEKRIWKIALLPAAANVLMQCFWAQAFYYAEPAFVNLLAKSSVVWVAALSIIFFPEERGVLTSRRFRIGVVLSVIGVVGVAVFKEDFTARATIIGIALSLCCGAAWGMYTVSARWAFSNSDSRLGFAVTCLYSTLCLAGLAFMFGRPGQALEMSVRPWACVIISGLVAIAFAHVLFYAAMRRLGAAIPSVAILVLPFTVLIVSHIVFGETINLPQLIFGVVLISGASAAVMAQQHLGRKEDGQ